MKSPEVFNFNPGGAPEDFEKNFQRILKIVAEDLGGLEPIREERARKIFNECVRTGLTPTAPEKTGQIIEKIKEDLASPDQGSMMHISGREEKETADGAKSSLAQTLG